MSYTYQEALKQEKYDRPTRAVVPPDRYDFTPRSGLIQVSDKGGYVIASINDSNRIQTFRAIFTDGRGRFVGNEFLFYDSELKLWVASHRDQQVCYASGDDLWNCSRWSFDAATASQLKPLNPKEGPR